MQAAVRGGFCTSWWSAGAHSAMHAACQHGHLAVATWLYKNVPAAGLFMSDIPSSRGRNPLHEACRVGELPIIQWLCLEVPEARASVLQLDRDGRSPLALACVSGNLPVVRWMHENLEKETLECLSLQDKNGRTPLAAACCEARMEVVEYLCRASPTSAAACVSEANKVGKPLFSEVVELGLSDVAWWLYDNVGEVQSLLMRLDTPVHPFRASCLSPRSYSLASWLAGLPNAHLYVKLPDKADKSVPLDVCKAPPPLLRQLSSAVDKALNKRAVPLLLMLRRRAATPQHTAPAAVVRRLPRPVALTVKAMLLRR